MPFCDPPSVERVDSRINSVIIFLLWLCKSEPCHSRSSRTLGHRNTPTTAGSFCLCSLNSLEIPICVRRVEVTASKGWHNLLFWIEALRFRHVRNLRLIELILCHFQVGPTCLQKPFLRSFKELIYRGLILQLITPRCQRILLSMDISSSWRLFKAQVPIYYQVCAILNLLVNAPQGYFPFIESMMRVNRVKNDRNGRLGIAINSF